jgi:hypothetical protein
MPIQNSLSAIVSQVAKNPLDIVSSRAIADASEIAEEEKSTAQPEVGRKSNSGCGLNLELSLASGQVVKLDIRLNQAGGLSQLSLKSNNELSARDEEKLIKFLTQLSSAVDDLFSRQSDSSSLFQFANQQGIEEVDFNAYLDCNPPIFNIS